MGTATGAAPRRDERAAIATCLTRAYNWRISKTKTLALLFTFALGSALAARAEDHAPSRPKTVVVPSGTLKLHALLGHRWGEGPFPAVLFNHGRGNTPEKQAAQAAAISPIFAKHGYVLLFLYRRGSGLSADQGTSAIDLMDRELAAHGQAARNRLQLELLQTDHLTDARAGLTFLRALPEVDKRRIAIAGHSFGASLTLLVTERHSALHAAVAFPGSTASWDHSPQLRERLIAAVRRKSVPIFFIEAENDYSIAPAKTLSAEMERLGKPHRIKIYPPVGQTADDGHGFVFSRVGEWEPDVFNFLQERMRP